MVAYVFALAAESGGRVVVETLGLDVAVIDDVAADDDGPAIDSVASEAAPADADVSAADVVQSAQRVSVTVA